MTLQRDISFWWYHHHEIVISSVYRSEWVGDNGERKSTNVQTVLHLPSCEAGHTANQVHRSAQKSLLCPLMGNIILLFHPRDVAFLSN